MNTISTIALKVVLVILGLYGLFLAIDFGFGGFVTLGLQGARDFVQVVDAARYGVQDRHFRFQGGVFAAIGLLMIVAVSNLQKYQQVLNVLFALIFVGGIMRLTSGDLNVLLGAEVAAALFAETVVIAILYLWLAREVKGSQAGTVKQTRGLTPHELGA